MKLGMNDFNADAPPVISSVVVAAADDPEKEKKSIIVDYNPSCSQRFKKLPGKPMKGFMRSTISNSISHENFSHPCWISAMRKAIEI